MKLIRYVVCLSIMLYYQPLAGQRESPVPEPAYGDKPGCDCDSLWQRADVREFTLLLEKATAHRAPVWPGYRLADASFVLNAGKTANGENCLGLWRHGKAESYAKLRHSLQMLTPIYSYYLHYEGMDSMPGNGYFRTAQDAPGFTKWMSAEGVSSAVYMPVDFPKLPFKLPALVKVQLAIHEAFHVEVMIKYWYTGKGAWPAWDRQPDRKALQICYTCNDTGRVLINKELSILSNMIEELLSGRKKEACDLGLEYLKARTSRYERLTNVRIGLPDTTNVNCQTAENLMELEEGLADYGSWTMLYQMGIASKEQLLKRYRAKQNDHYYLSGCMLMHAITLMSSDPRQQIVGKIVNAGSVDEGSLLNLFKIQLQRYASRIRELHP